MRPLRWFCVSVLLAAPLAGAEKRLTLDELYDPEKKVDFDGDIPTVRWMKDGKFYLQIKTDRKTGSSEWMKVDTATGRAEPFYDAAKMEAALLRIPGVAADDAKKMARQKAYDFSAQENAVLLSIADDLYAYELGADRAVRLTSTPEVEREAAFSPDGRFVAFVRGGNLYLVDRETQK